MASNLFQNNNWPEDYEYPNEIWTILPFKIILLKCSVLAPVVIFGIIGNILLLHIIFINRSLHTPTNFLIFNMAIADLLTLIINPVLFLYKEVYQNFELGEIGCKTEAMVETALLIVSVITLCFISKDRLTAIAFPTEKRLDKITVRYAIGFTWIAGFSLSTPLAIFRYYHERQWKNFLEIYCAEDIKVLPLYWHFIVIALMWIPLAVLVCCYSLIFLKLSQHEKRVKKKRENPIMIQRSYKRKIALTLFVVVLSFVVFRMPFTSLVFIRYHRFQSTDLSQISESFEILWSIAHYLIFVDCALTPVIYGIMNENFRRAFRSTIVYRCCCRFRKSARIDIFSTSKNKYDLNTSNPQTAEEDKPPKNNFKIAKY